MLFPLFPLMSTIFLILGIFGLVILILAYQNACSKTDYVFGTVEDAGCFGMTSHIMCSRDTLNELCHTAIVYLLVYHFNYINTHLPSNLPFLLPFCKKFEFFHNASFCLLFLTEAPWISLLVALNFLSFKFPLLSGYKPTTFPQLPSSIKKNCVLL